MVRSNGPGRRREPVRLVGGAGVLVLDVQVKRAAYVVSQWVAVAEGEAVKRVGNLEAFLVVHRDRPEGVDWWQFLLVEVQNIVVSPSSCVPSASVRTMG